MHAPAANVIPVDLLLRAYRAGVFPMADHRSDPEVYWVEPRERAVIPLDGFRVSTSLRKTLRQDRFTVTCDRDFAGVIAACAQPREEHAESWISHRIEASYNALHHAGHAHSIECWLDGELAGGLYGVAFDRVFCGESMFSRATDASKVALAWLVAAMRDAGYRLLDCQFMTDHLATMGAMALPQAGYLELLSGAMGQPRCSIPAAMARYSAASSAAAGASAAGAGAAAAGEGAAAGAGSPRSSPRAEPPSSPGKLIAQSLTQTS
ncbi:leucyl/phenylalanyl-tRNA--protein transferase [Qipengyuania sp. 6B39]|uniref:leucyl/phenylalanyl-tRNA--protein transferase n=1 Tax=Qipengyuania proteolytica TaxID=2867239 RepID=UPI001C894E3F|nr:leucyl/phenylalanyl-tRNA--protein transferase [Qipengyuania proteolytica]MBX7497045.1 leucyl/phenylalanyl-tRNA--protein transferase [Qipengyuania proteolytica]